MTLVFMAKNPEVKKKLEAEIEEFIKSDEDITS